MEEGENNGGLRILEGEQISNEDQLLFLFERVNYRKTFRSMISFEKGPVEYSWYSDTYVEVSTVVLRTSGGPQD